MPMPQYLLVVLALLTMRSMSAQSVVSVSEISLRKLALEETMPSYPDSAYAAKAQGVCVISIRVDRMGTVTQAEVLESPHPDIARAAGEAARKWHFRTQKFPPLATHVAGKLTFYYVLKDRRVDNPMAILSTKTTGTMK